MFAEGHYKNMETETSGKKHTFKTIQFFQPTLYSCFKSFLFSLVLFFLTIAISFPISTCVQQLITIRVIKHTFMFCSRFAPETRIKATHYVRTQQTNQLPKTEKKWK